MNLDKYYESHSPGYVIEIYNNGKTEEYVYGNKAVIPKVEKATKDTLYDIASLTKVFTATLIYMAYVENLINLNDNIYNINTNFKNLKNVTIIDLLSHNQNIWTNGYLGAANSKEDFYNILYSAYVKDTIPTYVDTHYMILSTILETIYKESFDDAKQALELNIHRINKKLNDMDVYQNNGIYSESGDIINSKSSFTSRRV